jgi:hypothetical protein
MLRTGGRVTSQTQQRTDDGEPVEPTADLQQLADLRAAAVLSDDKFAAAKARLLGPRRPPDLTGPNGPERESRRVRRK